MKQTAEKSQNQSTSKNGSKSDQKQVAQAENQVQECADQIVEQIRVLRKLQEIENDTDIAVYITDTPLVHSALEVHRDRIEEKTNAVDFVQVNIDAGNPMPEHLPHKEIEIGDQHIQIAIDDVEK